MYRTCPSFPSCLSDSLARSLWNTSSTMTCFQIFSRRKQLFSRYWLALDSGDLAMPRSTTTRYWSGCKSLTGRCWTGSPHLCGRTSAACSTPSAEYHRDLIHSVHRWPASVGDSSWLRGRPLRESVCLCRSNRLQLNHAKTSQFLSERALRLYVRSGACSDLCHDTPCWLLFVHYCNSVLAGIPGQLQDRIECRRPFRLLSEAITSWTPLVESSGASHIPAVFMEQRRRTLLRACTEHLTSTLDVVCALLTQPCWWYRPTLGDQRLRHVRRLSGMRRRWRRSVASWRPVVVWQWLGDRDCTAHNCCLSAILSFCLYFFSVLILYGAPAMSLTW